MDKGGSTYFLRQEIQMANTYMRKCSIPLTFREILIKPPRSLILSKLRWLLPKNQKITNADEHVEKIKLKNTVNGIKLSTATMFNSVGNSQKKSSK